MGEKGDVFGVGGQVRLRDAVATGLEDDGCAVEVEGFVAQEGPGDAAGASVGSGARERELGWVRGYEREAEEAGRAHDGCPDPEGGAEAVGVDQGAHNEGAGRADYIFG